MPKNQKKKSIKVSSKIRKNKQRIMCDAPKCRQKAMVSLCYDHYNKILNNTITEEEKLMLKKIRAIEETEKERQNGADSRLMESGFSE